MEQVILELFALALALGGVGVGAVKLAVRQSEKALNSERAAREALEKSLRDDVKAAEDENAKLRYSVRDLEAKRQADMVKMQDLESGQRTLLSEMAALQAQVKTLQAALDVERDEKTRAISERDELRARLADVERTLATVTTQRDELRGLIAGRLDVGAEPVEGKPSTKDVKEAARKVNAEVDATLAKRKTGEQAAVSAPPDAGERVTDVGDTGQQGG